jgi:hypothetical protein
MWTISDYPGYGLISGVCMHGYRGCEICGPQTDSRLAKSGNKLDVDQNVRGRKIVFEGSRRWTRQNHPYQRNVEFNGKDYFRRIPVRMMAEDTIRCVEARQVYLIEGGRENSKHDLVHVHGIKRKSILFELPYWKVRLKRT